jgi:spermidine synthase
MRNIKKAPLGIVAISLLLLWAGFSNWPYTLIGTGYTYLTSPESVDRIVNSNDSMSWYQDQSGSAAVFENEHGKLIVHDGYPTLYFDDDGIGITQEQLIVATNISLLTPDERDRALIIGYGTGSSSGVAADHFNSLRIYEIREAMVDLSKAQFGEESRHVFDRDNVEIINQDGIIGVESSDRDYNAIFVNIPSPGFKGAEKIWSVETLRSLKDKLRPGGIINMWMHLGLGAESASIMRNTIDRVFDECRTFVIGSGYYSVSCGENIKSRDLLDINDYPEFHWHFSKMKTDFGKLARAAEIHEITTSWRTSGDVNTYDKPLLGVKAHYWPYQDNREKMKAFAEVFPPVNNDLFCDMAEYLGAYDHMDLYCSPSN